MRITLTRETVMRKTKQQPKDTNEWMIKVNDELNYMGYSSTEKEMEQWKKRSIYKVIHPNMEAYQPQTVSFGPYHHGEAHLKPMEKHKHRAMLHFLKRSKKPLDLYVNSLTGVERDLKDSYDCLDKEWQENTNRFLQLMVMDGCFMLEILRTSYLPGKKFYCTSPQTMDDYARNDPIFSEYGKVNFMPYIKRDMLLLENQLPMLVLTRLLAVEDYKTQFTQKQQDEREFLNQLVLNFFSSPIVDPRAYTSEEESTTKLRLGNCLHVLDVYRKSLLWEDPFTDKDQGIASTSDPVGTDEIIRSATELNEAGIKFSKSESESLKDITFFGGVLRLPGIVVDAVTEPLFRNLIAFERFHVEAGKEVTSYVFLMGNLISNVEDVCLLTSQQIIQNAIGSDEAVANLFNSLSRDVTLDPKCSLNAVHKEATKYCKNRWNWWNQWRDNFIQTCSRNRWAILSAVAAIVIFAPRHSSNRVAGQGPQPQPQPQPATAHHRP
ncbi:UPF0481 protein At3g47200-like [Cornus florida]|uniref:UPF0481 protein At3g47200-like n=1 Tax=Cornus florida TaxID=4283 RepID=UPI00289BBB39|nr:UPF0481 protein At3g47200-like [Cornus florida]